MFEQNVKLIREAIVAAGIVGVFDTEDAGAHAEAIEEDLLDVLDGLEANAHSASLARSYMRRALENQDINIEEFFDTYWDDPECRDTSLALSVVGDALHNMRYGEPDEEDQDVYFGDVLAGTLAAMYCSAFQIPSREFTVTTGEELPPTEPEATQPEATN